MLEQLIIYLILALVIGAVFYSYFRKLQKVSEKTAAKVEQAKLDGVYEPVSLHPKIDLNTCIKSGACVEACPEKDILGIQNGRATLINASNCVGHGACYHACPVEAISLVIGTEKRGVDLPHVSQNYESNVPGVYIAGELGGMGLIKNSVEQGAMAIESLLKKKPKSREGILDVVIIGAGPAGIAATLNAHKNGLNYLTLEQDSLGGTVFTFPRAKVVMTSPMDLPLHGKVKLSNTSKQELLTLWNSVLNQNNIAIREHTKVEEIARTKECFEVRTNQGEVLKTDHVVLAIGRRGTPRKLGIPGENLEKVAYRLLEPELIEGKKIVVVGGGDSAIESALLLAPQNEVILSYRSDAFSRLKPKNRENILAAEANGSISIKMSSNLTNILEKEVIIRNSDGSETTLANDLVYIFAGGELPTDFLKKTGVEITRRFGFTVRSHK